MQNSIKQPEPRKGYPLFVLFMATGIVGVVVVQFKLVLDDGEITAAEIAMSLMTGAVCGMILGGIVGLFDLRRRRGLMLGAIAGLLVGALAGPIVLASSREPLTAILSSFVSAVLLVGLATAYRSMMLRSKLPFRSKAGQAK